MFLKEFNSTELQREADKVFKEAYKKPIRITRQKNHGVVMMSEKEYMKLVTKAA